MELCGPSRTYTPTSKLYLMLIIDGFNGMMWVSFLGEKSKTFEKFKDINAVVENETAIIKCIRANNGGYLTSK